MTTDPAELEAFLDEELGREMEKYHIAGAAVSVVKDGELVFAKGYGYADLENKIPVDPEQTIFRIGSVGKLFTWTAVMQLYFPRRALRTSLDSLALCCASQDISG